MLNAVGILIIQIRRGLIRDEQYGTFHDRSSNRRTLAFSSAEFGWNFVFPGSQAYQIKCLIDSCASIRFAESGHR
jgi:hypothetical protein